MEISQVLLKARQYLNNAEAQYANDNPERVDIHLSDLHNLLGDYFNPANLPAPSAQDDGD